MDALPNMLPDITIDPVRLHGGALCLQLGGRIVPLRLGQDPVTTFVPGWRVEFAYTGFDPFVVLQFIHETGAVACWIVSGDGARLGGSLGELDPGARDSLCAAATAVVRRLVSIVLEQPVVALDGPSRAFLRLPEDMRRDIAQLCAASALPQARRVVLDAAPDQWDDAWKLSRLHVEALLSASYQDRLLATAQDGMLSWPSPIDGRMLTVQGSLCSDDFRFAYRLADSVHGLVCYPIVSDHHAITICLYVPVRNVVIVRNATAQDLFDLYFPDFCDWLVKLISRLGITLEKYFSDGAKGFASIMRGWPANHLGHQLWNELTGIEHFLRLSQGGYIPEWIVPGAQVELWGSITEIFPQLLGHVDRSAPNPSFAIARSYETGTCLVRITQKYVAAELRTKLLKSIKCSSNYRSVQEEISQHDSLPAPIIVIGLRVENRTIVDLLDFCEELLDFIAKFFPGATLVIDGHNSIGDGQLIISNGEHLAAQSPVRLERQIVAHLKRLQVGRPIKIVDTIGSSICTSLAWCAFADCFFSIWGASLAKYRWACNKPGLVITNKWNLLNRNDLDIYHSPAFMESPCELEFVGPSLIQDLPEAPLLVNFGPDKPYFVNFNVNNGEIFSHLEKFINKVWVRTTCVPALVSTHRRS